MLLKLMLSKLEEMLLGLILDNLQNSKVKTGLIQLSLGKKLKGKSMIMLLLVKLDRLIQMKEGNKKL